MKAVSPSSLYSIMPFIINLSNPLIFIPVGEYSNKYWRDNSEAIAKKLRNFMKRNPKYSPDEILKATERYVESFHGNYSLMRILPYFIEKEGNSELLTFLEVDTSTGGEYMNIQQMI